MRAALILEFTLLATLSLLDAPFALSLPVRWLTSCSVLSLACITALLKGASYELEHCHKAGRKEKKHASDLLPYPPELVPFSRLMGRIRNMDSSTNQSPHTPSKRTG
jgi:hypothetical protein